VTLGKGTQAQAEALRQATYAFLNTALRFALSKGQPQITPGKEGFKFLGFWRQRGPGDKGLTTEIVIPTAAMAQVTGQEAQA
jgi:hypothetical protein